MLLAAYLLSSVALSFPLILWDKFQTNNLHLFPYCRYENRTGRLSYRLGKRRRYIKSRPQFLIRRRWRRARRVRGRMRVRVGRRYRRVEVKRGKAAFGGNSRWRGIRRPKIRRGAVMRVRCGGILRKIYKRGRKLVMKRKGRLRTVRWGFFLARRSIWLSSHDNIWLNYKCFLNVVSCLFQWKDHLLPMRLNRLIEKKM